MYSSKNVYPLFCEGSSDNKIKCKNNKKCEFQHCNKKLKLTDFKCRCEHIYCQKHRYAEQHNCTYDYRNMGKILIEKENPKIGNQKINQI